MIEPTETESLRSVEQFCQVMIKVAGEALEDNAFEKHFKDRPRHVAYGRVNETLAAKQQTLFGMLLEEVLKSHGLALGEQSSAFHPTHIFARCDSH